MDFEGTFFVGAGSEPLAFARSSVQGFKGECLKITNPQAEKQRINRDVAADVVVALLKETAEFRVFQLTITHAEGRVVVDANAAVQPSYKLQ